MRSIQQSFLVIDDDDAFRGRLARALAVRGFEVFQATNVDEALALVDQQQPGRIILDLKLRSESGLQILSRLSSGGSSARVVVLTGYGTIATAVEALKLGALNYLTKPVDADAILAAFDDGQSDARAATASPKLSQIEWEHIQRVMQDCGGNITHASKILGLHRRSLQRKLSKTPLKLR